MISVDTNILWAALDADNARHQRAVEFLQNQTPNAEFALCELVLIELYVLMRNPALADPPLDPSAAAAVIDRYRRHPVWRIIDYPGRESGIMDKLWKRSAAPGFPRRQVFDVRLALTLRHHAVTEFATGNVKDFQGFGFTRVWNPLE